MSKGLKASEYSKSIVEKIKASSEIGVAYFFPISDYERIRQHISQAALCRSEMLKDLWKRKYKLCRIKNLNKVLIIRVS